MIVAVEAMSCLVSSWMIIHFGRNPVSGGRPARDSSVSKSIAFSDGAFVHVVISVDRFRALVVFRVRNTAAVIMAYR